MRHEEFSEARLLRFLDGEATVQEREAVHAHLEACWECRGRLTRLERDLHRIADRVGDPSHAVFPEAKLQQARARLQAAMCAERGRPPERREPRLSWFWRLAWIPATAAAFTGGYFWVASRPQSLPPPVVAVVKKAPLVIEPRAERPVELPVRPAPVVRPAPIVGPQRAELLGLAVRAYEAAHRLGLAVDRNLQVRIEGSHVRVSGLTPEEEADLKTVLALNEDQAAWLAGSEPVELPPDTVETAIVQAPEVNADARIAMHDALAVLLGSEAKVKAFADRAIRLSESLNRQVRALHEMATTIPETDQKLLDDDAEVRLSLLVVEHLRALELDAGELRTHLRPLIQPVETPVTETTEAWQQVAEHWASEYAPIHRSVLDLFALHPGRQTDLAGSTEVLSGLWRLEAGRDWHPRVLSRDSGQPR